MSSLAEIDWSLIWREGRKRRSCKSKGCKEWNRKAASFARRNRSSAYIDKLLPFIDMRDGETVLDVGCGPGTLALPLARIAKSVTALDFSAEMLAELRSAAAEEGLENIATVLAAWEDDWQPLGVEVHDIAVASRSLAVDDLAAALVKLNEWARRKVIITDRVGAGPFDPDVFAAVGRPFEVGPDYIITVNLLYQMGINAKVDFIPAEFTEFFATRAEAADSCLWMLDELRPGEQADFERFLDERLVAQPDGSWRLERNYAPRWAVVSWDKN
jgi:SAM-dependent methyltransferase